MTQPALHSDAHRFDPSILRAYDIRGIVGKTLSEDDAYAVGQAFATMVVEKSGKAKPTIAIGYDGRISSPHFEEAVTSGLVSCGAIVEHVGLGPTPMLYFAVRSRQLDGGIMVTGSHNPPSHNGFKLMYAKEALFGEEIQRLGKIAAAGNFAKGQGKGELKPAHEAYVQELIKGFDGQEESLGGMSIAWDAGNGATGEIVQVLTQRLPGKHHLLFTDINGEFPNHHPDPSEAKNLQDLIQTVKKERCDLGIAFDGDGDRIGVVDSQGRILWGDQLMQLFARDVLKNNPGATIIADVKASQTLFDAVEKLGGKPMVWKTGHSFIKSRMAETGALLAGEMSGHMFFADRYYGFDDGIYAAVRLLKFIAGEGKSLARWLDEMPKVCNTPEIRLDVPEERKFAIVEEVRGRLKKANVKFSDIDGVRVMTDYGWWILRASNTQAALSLRAEAPNEALLEDLKRHVEKQLEMSGIKMTLPGSGK